MDLTLAVVTVHQIHLKMLMDNITNNLCVKTRNHLNINIFYDIMRLYLKKKVGYECSITLKLIKNILRLVL